MEKKCAPFVPCLMATVSILVCSSFTHWTLREHWGHNIGIIPDKSHEQMSLHHFFFFHFLYLQSFSGKKNFASRFSFLVFQPYSFWIFGYIYIFFCSVRKCFCCCSFICTSFLLCKGFCFNLARIQKTPSKPNFCNNFAV